MSSRPSSKPPRGMRDLLPREVALRDQVQEVIQRVYRGHGYMRVETPALESLALLAGGQGGENEKLIFRVLERGEKLAETLRRLAEQVAASDAGALEEAAGALAELGLRFDLTVPLARFYAEHHAELPRPFKAIQIGPVWRAERPQKGRYRQFVQCDIDVLGDGGPCVEAELVAATCAVFAALGLPDVVLRYNDRRLLSALAASAGVPDARRDAVLIALDKFDKLGREGVRAELLALPVTADAAERLLELVAPRDGAAPALRACVEALPASPAVEAAAASLESLAGALAAVLPAGTTARFDPSLVRGMGYYTGPIFELGLEGYGFSLAGGGRYDEMIGRLLGQSIPACGFSIGFERLVLVLQERGWQLASGGRRVALLYEASHAPGEVLAAAERLRGSCAVVSVLPRQKKMARQLDELGAAGFDGFSVFDGAPEPTVRPLTTPVDG